MQRLFLLWCAIALPEVASTQEQASDLSEVDGDNDAYGDGSGYGGSSVLDLTNSGVHAGDNDGGNVPGSGANNVLDFSTQHVGSSSSESRNDPSDRVPVSSGKPKAHRHHRRHASDDDDDDDEDDGKGGGDSGSGGGGLDLGSLEDGLHKGGDQGVDNLIKALSAMKMGDMGKISVGTITKDKDGNDVYDLRASATQTTTLGPQAPLPAQDGAASTTLAPAIVTEAPHAAPVTYAAPSTLAPPPAQQQGELSSPQPQALTSPPQAITSPPQQTMPPSQVPAVPKEQSRAKAETNTAPSTQPAQSSQLQPPQQTQPEVAHHAGTKHHHGKKHHHHRHHRGDKGKGRVTVDARPLLAAHSPGTPVAQLNDTKAEPVKRGLPKLLPAGAALKPEQSPRAPLPGSQPLVSSPLSVIDQPATLPMGKTQEQEQVATVAHATFRSQAALPMQQDVQGLTPASSTAVDLSRGLYDVRQNLDVLIREADSLMGRTAGSTSGQIPPGQALSSASATMPAGGWDVRRPLAALGTEQRVQPSLVSANSGEFLRRLQVLEQENKNEATKMQAVEAGERKDEQRIAALEKENRLLRGLVLGRHR